jgi:copper homeostasis protein
MTRVDIAVTTLEDALNAQIGGADSIEISMDLAADGLTPPLELVKQIRDAVQLQVHVIVRPHNRDFNYTEAETDLMLRDAERLMVSGADGIAIGAHLPDGRFNVALVHEFARVVPYSILTIHRALDTCTNPIETLQQVRGIARRILVSGGAPNVDAGKDTLQAWVDQFGAHYRFVAAGSVRLETAYDLVVFTGVQEVHTASAVRTQGVVDVAKVRQLVERLRAE